MGRVVRSGPEPHHTATRRLAIIAAGTLLFAACGGAADSPDEPTSTSAPAVSTTVTTAPTTTAEPTTSTTTVPPTALEELGFPVSDDWVVETVVTDIDSATGGLAMDPDGNFYQADFGYKGHVGNTVWKVTPDGEVSAHATHEDMDALTMTVRLDDGTIWQSAYGDNTVFKIEPDGTAAIFAEGIRGPTGIVVNDDGSLFVEAYNSNILHHVASDGTVTDFVEDPRFNGINGMTQGPDGTLYLVDHKDGGLFSVTLDGVVDKLFEFPRPTSHGVYLDGSIFVTSRGGYVVFRYDIATGDVEIIAGNGEPGNTDGRGGAASFGRPNAIIVGPDGALYTNHGEGTTNDPVSIRRISFDPVG